MMASSQSIRRTQIPKPCDFCESDINIRWFCEQCRKLICDKCKKIHLNTPTCAQHELTDVKHRKVRTKNTNNVPCKHHRTKMVSMFCRTCGSLVCPDCVSEYHTEHNLNQLDETLQKILQNLENLQVGIFTDDLFRQDEGRRLQRAKDAHKSNLDETVIKINKRETEMNEIISKHAQEMRNQIAKERTSMTKVASEMERKIKDTEQKLQEKQNEIEDVVQSGSVEDIFASACSIVDSLPDLHFQQLSQEALSFSSDKFDQEAIEDLFGSLKLSKLAVEELHFDFKVVKSYGTDLTFVNPMVTLNDRTAWIANSPSRILRTVHLDDRISTTNELSAKVFDIALMPSNEIILSIVRGNDLQILTKSGELEHFIPVAPLYTLGIHVTKYNELIVGVTNEANHFKLTGKSCRKVLVFGINKKLKKSFEYDQHKQRLFSAPCKITTNVNNDIIVCDMDSRTSGRLLALGKEGGVKWVYQGHPPINTWDKTFNPYGILTNSAGHVIVADHSSSVLHILSKDGKLLVCKDFNVNGILNPSSLDIDALRQLWVGCSSEDGNANAKIHIVKISW